MASTRLFTVRALTRDDEPLLWDMLYEAIFVPAGEPKPEREIVRRPELAKYVNEWGKEDDVGFAAIDPDTRQVVGAAWFRLFPEDDPGYGYVNEITPELSIAVLPEYRGYGAGSRLILYLIEVMLRRYPALSLSVSKGNPAAAWYQRLGFKVVRSDDTSYTMLFSPISTA